MRTTKPTPPPARRRYPRRKEINTIELLGELSRLHAGRHARDGVTPAELASVLRMSAVAVRNHLRSLTEQGVLVALPGPRNSVSYVMATKPQRGA